MSAALSVGLNHTAWCVRFESFGADACLPFLQLISSLQACRGISALPSSISTYNCALTILAALAKIISSNFASHRAHIHKHLPHSHPSSRFFSLATFLFLNIHQPRHSSCFSIPSDYIQYFQNLYSRINLLSKSFEMAPKAADKKPASKAPATASKAPEKKDAGKKTAASGDKKKRTKARKETYSSYIYKGKSLHFKVLDLSWIINSPINMNFPDHLI